MIDRFIILHENLGSYLRIYIRRISTCVIARNTYRYAATQVRRTRIILYTNTMTSNAVYVSASTRAGAAAR